MEFSFLQALLTIALGATVTIWGWGRATVEKLFDEYNSPAMSKYRNQAYLYAKENPDKPMKIIISELGTENPPEGYFSLWIVARFFERMIISYDANTIVRRRFRTLFGYHFLWWHELYLYSLYEGSGWPIEHRFNEFRQRLRDSWPDQFDRWLQDVRGDAAPSTS